MAQIKLDKLSLAELKALQKDVSKAIDAFEANQRKAALAAVEAKAREMGFSLAELTGLARKTKVTATPKYCHPENAELTWSGRGRRPAWFIEAVASGTDPKDLLVA